MATKSKTKTTAKKKTSTATRTKKAAKPRSTETLVELKVTGTKLQRTCVVLQLIVLVVMVLCNVYCNIHEITTGPLVWISDYGLYVVILLLLATILDEKN